MTHARIQVTTGSRLHFGLLSWSPRGDRRFGGLGLMIERPGVIVRAQHHPVWHAEGTLAARALDVAREVASRLEGPVSPLKLEVEQVAQEHVGLGTGTQLSLATALAVVTSTGRPQPSSNELTRLTGRGRRSGIGVHGFNRGGFLVDGGHGVAAGQAAPPLLFQSTFPSDWAVLVVVPPAAEGLSGPDEVRAFERLPEFPQPLVDRLCRLVLLGVLPALVENDLRGFGSALEELQRGVGEAFAPAQGGRFAHPALEEMAAWLRGEGVVGMGQSSWGPTLYGFTDADPDGQAALRSRILLRYGLDEDAVFWTVARNRGAHLEVDHSPGTR